MGHYIYNNKVVEKAEPVDTFIRSFLLEEQENYFVIMNDEQVAYYLEHPDATVDEIFYLGSNNLNSVQNDTKNI